jgi:predicted nucleic-acid-binding Zn-ribbon protein
MNEIMNYRCPRCSQTVCDVGEMRAAGGFWSKIFDVQGAKFSSVTCENCKYTEFYKSDTSTLGNIFDLFTN